MSLFNVFKTQAKRTMRQKNNLEIVCQCLIKYIKIRKKKMGNNNFQTQKSQDALKVK